jgi:integrase/DNA-binding transcriptional ArsR family regulator
MSLLLNTDEICACDVATGIGKAAASASHHLKLLRDAGLVTADKRGYLDPLPRGPRAPHCHRGRTRFLVRYRDPSGKQRARTFVSKKAAIDYEAEVRTDMRRGAYLDPQAGQMKVKPWSEKWIAAQGHLKPSTFTRYKGLLKVQILPRWGGYSLHDVDFLDVQGWVSDLTSSGLSGSTVRQAHRVFSLLMETSVRSKRLLVNPAVGVKLPRAGKPEKKFLTHQQVTDLAEAAGDSRAVILVLSYCGLRRGELAALRVGRVDTMRRRLNVTESVTEDVGKLTWGNPKNHERRSVPIPRFLVDELDVLKAGKGPNDLMFTGARGGVLRNGNFRRYCFDAAAVKAGLDGLTPHELRHTAASLAVSAGANVKGVQRMLGHASAAMTLDVYSGLFDDDLDGVADRLDEAHVYSACIQADAQAKDKKASVSEIHSATTNLA